MVVVGVVVPAVALALALAVAVEVVAAGCCERPHKKLAVQELNVAAPTKSTRIAAALMVANQAAEHSDAGCSSG